MSNNQQFSPQYQGMPYAPAPPPPQFTEPQPGVVPLRPLTLGDMFAGAWRAIWHNPAVMIGLSLLIIVIANIVGALLGWPLMGPMTSWVNESIDQARTIPDPAIQGALQNFVFDARNTSTLFGTGITSTLVTPIVSGVLAVAVSQAVLGNRISMGDTWRRVASRIGALIGWAILSAIAAALLVVIGTLAIAGITLLLANLSEAFAAAVAVLLVIALVVVIIWLSIRLLFVPVAIVVEQATIRQALRRSWELTRHHFWRIFGIYLLTSLLMGIITSLISIPFSAISAAIALGGGGGIGSLLLSLLTNIISSLVTLGFTAGVMTLLYIDSRIRSEGLHNSLIQATSAAY